MANVYLASKHVTTASYHVSVSINIRVNGIPIKAQEFQGDVAVVNSWDVRPNLLHSEIKMAGQKYREAWVFQYFCAMPLPQYTNTSTKYLSLLGCTKYQCLYG